MNDAMIHEGINNLEDHGISLWKGDCLSYLDSMEEESIDLLVTDPPYKLVGGGCTKGFKRPVSGILSRERAEARKGTLFKNNDMPFEKWVPKVYRVLKNGTHAYIMINPRNYKALLDTAENCGFKFQQIIIWNKNNSTPNQTYMNSYEMILMLRKGKAKPITNRGTKNVLDVQNIIGKKLHPTEKPVRLMEILIENSSSTDDLVLDPFMGAGATGIAAYNLGRRFVGIELDEEYFNIAQNRINTVIK